MQTPVRRNHTVCNVILEVIANYWEVLGDHLNLIGDSSGPLKWEAKPYIVQYDTNY